MIAWAHLSQSQCFFQKESGGVPNTDIYEHHMEYQNILLDVVQAIHSEAKSPFMSSEDAFMLFSSPEYCLTFKAELTIAHLESALEFYKNNTLLTNMVIFSKLAFYYTEEDGYPAILGNQDCKAWIKAIQEELNLNTEIPSESSQFLHLAVDQDRLIDINTLTYKSEVLCCKSKQITLDIGTQELVKDKILNQICAENWTPIWDIPNFGSFLAKHWVGDVLGVVSFHKLWSSLWLGLQNKKK